MTSAQRPAPSSISPMRGCGLLLAATVALSVAATGVAHGQADAKSKVAFVGDSTADGMWGGAAQLVQRKACLKGNVELGRFAKNSTGLTRPDKFNWVDELR